MLSSFYYWCCIPISPSPGPMSSPPRVIRRFKRRSCIYQSKRSFHQPSVKTGTTDLAYVNLDKIGYLKQIIVHLWSEMPGFLSFICRFSNKWSTNYKKTFKCMFCNVSASKWSRSMDIMVRNTGIKPLCRFKFTLKLSQCFVDRRMCMNVILCFSCLHIRCISFNSQTVLIHRYISGWGTKLWGA